MKLGNGKDQHRVFGKRKRNGSRQRVQSVLRSEMPVCRLSSSACEGPREIASVAAPTLPNIPVNRLQCRSPGSPRPLQRYNSGQMWVTRAACRPQQDRALRLSVSPSLKWVIANTYHRTPLHVRAPGGTVHAIGCTPTLGSSLAAGNGRVTKCPS